MINGFFAHCILKMLHLISDDHPAEATFRGGEYIAYDLQQRGVEPILSTNDEISLYFKTRKSSGLLFYTGSSKFNCRRRGFIHFQMMIYRNHWNSIYLIGNGKDYMNLALKDGTIALTVALGTGKLDTAIDPDNVRFDDNVWHHVLVQRHASDVSIKDLLLISS